MEEVCGVAVLANGELDVIEQTWEHVDASELYKDPRNPSRIQLGPHVCLFSYILDHLFLQVFLFQSTFLSTGSVPSKPFPCPT